MNMYGNAEVASGQAALTSANALLEQSMSSIGMVFGDTGSQRVCMCFYWHDAELMCC